MKAEHTAPSAVAWDRIRASLTPELGTASIPNAVVHLSASPIYPSLFLTNSVARAHQPPLDIFPTQSSVQGFSSRPDVRNMPTETITVTPTPTWVPLKIEGLVPAPYRTPKFNLRVVPLHPTFACELQGVDWSKDVSPELYQEIREIVDKVRQTSTAMAYKRICQN